MRKCKREECENKARYEYGVGRARELCSECYAHVVIRQARTQRMNRCACGNIASLNETTCRRCRDGNNSGSNTDSYSS